MPRHGPAPFRNRSPSGWWIVGEVQQWVPTKRGRARTFPTWENLRLIRASGRERAYRKAVRLAKAGMPSPTDGGQWRFVGLSLLLPVHDALEDGVEVLWTDHGSVGPGKLKRLIKSKRELPVFNDDAA